MKKSLLFIFIIGITVSNCFGQHHSLAANGVGVFDSTKTAKGVNLLDCTFWSILMDMNGNVLRHFPVGYPNLLPDGTIIGKVDSFLVKLDADLNIIWKVPVPIHHEVKVSESGNIYLLSYDVHEFLNKQVRFDVVREYSPEGKLIFKWSTYDHLEEFVSIISKAKCNLNLATPYCMAKGGALQYISQAPDRFLAEDSDTTQHPDAKFELSHFNSIYELPENKIAERIPAFRKGNLLLSFNPYSCYGILDTTSGKIEWVGYLPEATTLHTPKLTPQGTILVFQNCTRGRLWTSINEYDPLTGNMVWEWTAQPKESLCAIVLGDVERLPNRNTLICAVSEKGGRSFEVTPQKEIVWDFVFPLKGSDDNNTPLGFYRSYRIDGDLAQKFTKGFRQ